MMICINISNDLEWMFAFIQHISNWAILNSFISMGLWQWWIIHYLAEYIWASWLVGSVFVASSKKPKSKIIFENSRTGAKSQSLLLGKIILLTHWNGNFVLKSLYFFWKFENWFGQVVHQVNAWRISQNMNKQIFNFRPGAPRLFYRVFYLNDHIWSTDDLSHSF